MVATLAVTLSMSYFLGLPRLRLGAFGSLGAFLFGGADAWCCGGGCCVFSADTVARFEATLLEVRIVTVGGREKRRIEGEVKGKVGGVV